ncbi:hypothetical protein L210DRAFT_726533 [Boletus edulis BED1]|uniref:Uncharacterized protein n=1 Tax=Boletus edulis BED1 TaxID=1328754 RepID=A0AAD4BZB6_BOLED|nr:hypothetical protein L210DRAFT_726533 [Boletus edulis BED1]
MISHPNVTSCVLSRTISKRSSEELPSLIPARRRRDRRRGMVQEVPKELGTLNVLVANAGAGGLSTLSHPVRLTAFALSQWCSTAELQEWEQNMAVNALGTFLC